MERKRKRESIRVSYWTSHCYSSYFKGVEEEMIGKGREKENGLG